MARRHETPQSYYLTPRLVCATAALPVQCCRRRTLGVETALRSQHKKLRNLFSQLNSAGGLQLSTAGFSAVCLCQLKSFERYLTPFYTPLTCKPWVLNFCHILIGLVIIDFSQLQIHQNRVAQYSVDQYPVNQFKELLFIKYQQINET